MEHHLSAIQYISGESDIACAPMLTLADPALPAASVVISAGPADPEVTGQPFTGAGHWEASADPGVRRDRRGRHHAGTPPPAALHTAS